MARRGIILGCILLLSLAAPAHAARKPVPVVPPEPSPAVPVLPDDARWVAGVVTAIASVFGAALLIGPVYRLARPPELPPTHSHDEPPGASHHHGTSGTLNPEPDHGHANHGHGPSHSDHGHAGGHH